MAEYINKQQLIDLLCVHCKNYNWEKRKPCGKDCYQMKIIKNITGIEMDGCVIVPKSDIRLAPLEKIGGQHDNP